MLQVQNPHTGNFENLYVTGLPDPVPPQVIHVPAAKSNSHPLLIIGVVIGLFVGLIACLPPKIRGWIVLAILAGIVWLCWRANTDHAQYAGTEQPVPAHVPYVAPPARDYAPRAELVRLPPQK